MVAVAAAVANAIYYATGKRVRSLPITVGQTAGSLATVSRGARPPEVAEQITQLGGTAREPTQAVYAAQNCLQTDVYRGARSGGSGTKQQLAYEFFRRVWAPPHDLSAIDELMTEDYLITTAGQTIAGRDRFRAWVAQMPESAKRQTSTWKCSPTRAAAA